MDGGSNFNTGIVLVMVMKEVQGWEKRPAHEVFDPVPDPAAVVLFGNARFTILTSKLIRLEYASNGQFVDQASLSIINRLLPVPPFSSKHSATALVVNTGPLELHYDKILGFASLRIILLVNGTNSTWFPERINSGNLKGTRRSLDCRDNFPPGCTKSFPLDPGLISTEGWVLFDDSDTPLLNYSVSDGIPWITMPRARNGGGLCVDCHDWYFFGYGLDYTRALYDFSTLSGPIALPPSSAFGGWWSRYYAYSESQFISEVIDGYKNHSLPLNHVVLDMNWHIEPSVPHCNPSGGFTWNTHLFPDPPAFIHYLHQPANDLKLLLNAHPQYGIDACQTEYTAFAAAIAFDSSKNQTIPCDFMSHLVAINQFSVVMDAVGNDYWWTDFDGCHHKEDIDTHRYDLLWSNHVFHYEKATKGIRPLTLSRYGGPGNQRYPIGFSGDTYALFSTLQFEVYFTATAANILFGYWSHDSGGFRGEPSDELFLRWLQFAAVQPIYRIHSDHEERRIWEFPSYELMKETMLLRNSLGPYIYTQARRAYDTAVSLVHPHYHDFPQIPEAYNYPYQYMFGTDILAAPVVTPVNNVTNTTTKVIWLPPGSWIDFWTLEGYTGPMELNRTVGLPDLPLFVFAGAVIPLKTMASVTYYNSDPLIFAIFPGAQQGNTTYYEDDGNTTQYLEGAYSFMSVNYMVQGNTTKVLIGPTEGTFAGQPTSRTYQVAFKGVLKAPSSVTVNDGPAPTEQGPGWWVDSIDLMALVVQLSPASPLDTFSIVIQM